MKIPTNAETQGCVSVWIRVLVCRNYHDKTDLCCLYNLPKLYLHGFVFVTHQTAPKSPYDGALHSQKLPLHCGRQWRGVCIEAVRIPGNAGGVFAGRRWAAPVAARLRCRKN